ncbi:hypothetical protein LJC45_05890 [Alistipes sp. OttesenSCG-928-B03]|nr:hypothetical protein [Alistipes sp. OttesenSCG-928-B03]
MNRLVLLLTFALLCSASGVSAQNINEITAKGKKAYLEIKILKGEISDARTRAYEHLTGDEWNEWEMVDSPEESDFTIRLVFEKKGMNIMSMRSMGARVRVTAEIADREGKVLWRSKQYQGNVSEFTGFNALSDAMRKIVRRALRDELRGWK